MADETNDDELERRMKAKFFGKPPETTAEVRRSRKKRSTLEKRAVVEVEAQPIALEQGGDDLFVYVFKSVTEDGKRIHLKSIRGPESNDPARVIREFEAEGRIVKWVGKPAEKY
ncbi:hypothetical protein MRS76_11325 [Rhizobiaceae bacterium n13]|uniref:hypothetical protein n=1 Tax=Ferirhizobium litorale TaxID=2927786 RepID=UPI0024B28F0C|nr:hypothetical protein [Fererhizobium litorale]MDI7862552.1 hypothetical protein [Fererhizobium litorale]